MNYKSNSKKLQTGQKCKKWGFTLVEGGNISPRGKGQHTPEIAILSATKKQKVIPYEFGTRKGTASQKHYKKWLGNCYSSRLLFWSQCSYRRSDNDRLSR